MCHAGGHILCPFSGMARNNFRADYAEIKKHFRQMAKFLSPVAALIPAAAYAAALIYVGILMMGCVKDIQWDNPSVALPSFLTLATMAFTYNISYGIAFGLISHVCIRIFIGKAKDISVATWVITLLFAAMFFLTH